MNQPKVWHGEFLSNAISCYAIPRPFPPRVFQKYEGTEANLSKKFIKNILEERDILESHYYSGKF